jgi:hypothetical protein
MLAAHPLLVLMMMSSLQSMFSEADQQLLLALLQECAYSTADAAQILLGDTPLLSDSPTSSSSAAAASSFAQVSREQPLPRPLDKPLDKPLTSSRRLLFGPASSGSHASSSSSFSSGSGSAKGHRKGAASASSRPPVSSCNHVCVAVLSMFALLCAGAAVQSEQL